MSLQSASCLPAVVLVQLTEDVAHHQQTVLPSLCGRASHGQELLLSRTES